MGGGRYTCIVVYLKEVTGNQFANYSETYGEDRAEFTSGIGDRTHFAKFSSAEAVTATSSFLLHLTNDSWLQISIPILTAMLRDKFC
jgi:hypothetical protein